MQGERRTVTVLFCDVAGSTAMAEQLDPEEWAEIMNDAFGYLTGPVERYGGTVARLMGDAILAFFGAPTAHEDDPQRAVLAGLDILDGITPFREEIKDEYGLDFNVRVGINTGPVVVGEVGSDFAGEYTAMGDAVNVAARMEQTAQPGSVQVAENTQALTAPLFDFETLSSIEVKGKADPVATFRVLGSKAEPGRLRGIEGLSAPLVGRDEEFDTLSDVLSELREGRGQIVFMVGEPGLGKSRLIDELRRDWGDAPWIESRGISFDTARP
jgi:class 3 adenylate cyclase